MPNNMHMSSGVDRRRISRRRPLRVPEAWKLDLLAVPEALDANAAPELGARVGASDSRGAQSNFDSETLLANPSLESVESPKGYRPSNRYPSKHAATLYTPIKEYIATISRNNNKEQKEDFLTPPKAEKSCFCGGVDGGCRVSYYGSWFDGDEEKLDQFHGLLEEKKREAQRQQGSRLPAPVPLYVGNDVWIVAPHGMGQGIKCAWMIQRGGVKIGIHSNPVGTIPAILVEYDYQAVKGRNFFLEVVPAVEEVLRRLGFKIDRDVLSRIDLQITKVLPFEVVADAFNSDRFVSSFEKWQTNASQGFLDGRRRIESISAGTGAKSKTIALVIYDKFKECSDKNDGEKLDFIWERVGITDDLTRVEFRIYREWLHDHLIDSVYEFYLKLSDVVDYLTDDFFRVLADSKRLGHTREQKIAPWWSEIREHFKQVFATSSESPSGLSTRQYSTISFERLWKTSTGCLTSAFAVLPVVDKGKQLMTDFELRQALHNYIDLDFAQIREDYLRKRGEYLAQRQDIITTPIPTPSARIEQAKETLQERHWVREGAASQG